FQPTNPVTFIVNELTNPNPKKIGLVPPPSPYLNLRKWKCMLFLPLLNKLKSICGICAKI
ncbi:unnamed protein product, partial [Hymenolepis diminuta]